MTVDPATLSRVAATRIHTELGASAPCLDNLLPWCERALAYADQVIVATDEVLWDSITARLHPLRPHIHPLRISPWRGISLPLNAIIAEATVLGGKSLLLQSLEVNTEADNIQLLHQALGEDTLVVGAKLLEIHGRESGLQALNGLNTPWNTLALWDLPKLNFTGFLGVSNGFLTDIPCGIEEVTTISLLQHLFPDTSQAKLLTLPHHLHWDDQWDSPQRIHYHQQKIHTKFERAEIQLQYLACPRGQVLVE